MGVAAFGVVGGYHIGCHGLSKTAWTGDATIAVPSIYPVIKNLDQHRFIYIEEEIAKLNTHHEKMNLYAIL